MATKKQNLPTEYAKAFKDADIRGVYPREINETVAYRTARAFVELFELKKVIVGRDKRNSSPSLRNAFVDGVIDSGADVLDIGLVDTPAVYFASGTFNEYGVMITASHNPKQYNGLKLVKAGAIPLTNKTGLKTIQRFVIKNIFKEVTKKGRVTKKNILPSYKKYIRSKVSIRSPRSINIVADAGNGMATLLAPMICKGLPLSVTPLFFKLDGNFPNRGSNPTLAKNQKPVVSEIKKGGYDFGVAFDGDVDRVAFFDEHGNYINSAVIGALLVKHLLSQKPKQSFVYTVFTSRIYEETIKQYGGRAIRARVGHAFIKEHMRKYDAVFACEHSAHFYYKDNFYTDSGILSLLYLTEAYVEALKNGQTFSEMLAPFLKYFQTEELLVKVSDKKHSLKVIEQYYRKRKPLKVISFDGITFIFRDCWFVVKESVTEDAIKFVVESPKKKIAQTKKKEILTLLRSISKATKYKTKI